MSIQASPTPEPPQTIAHPSCFFSANKTLYAYTSAAELYALDLSSPEATFAWKMLSSLPAEMSNSGVRQRRTATCGILTNEGLIVVMTDTGDHVYDVTRRQWQNSAGNGADRSQVLVSCASHDGQMVIYDGNQTGLWEVTSATWAIVPAQDDMSPPLSTSAGDTSCASAGTFVYYLHTTQDQHGRIINELYGLDPSQRRWLGYLGSFWSRSEHVKLRGVLDLSAGQDEDIHPVQLYAFPDQEVYTFTLQPDGNIDPWFTLAVLPAEIGGNNLLGVAEPSVPVAQYITNFDDDLIAFYDNDEHVTLYNPSLNQIVAGYKVPHLPSSEDSHTALPVSIGFWDSPEGRRAKVAIGCSVAAAFLLWICTVCILWRFCRNRRSRRIVTTSQLSSLEEPQSIEKSVDTSIGKKVDSNQNTVKAFYFIMDPKTNGEDASTWSRHVRRTLAYIVYQYHQQQQGVDNPRARKASSSTLSIKTIGNISSTTHVSSSIGSRLRRFDADSSDGSPSQVPLAGHGAIDQTVAAAVNMVIRRALHLGRSLPSNPPSTDQEEEHR
ncbi:hypothetical protein BCR43DRAFT_510369 [Syncephalastrum racemosum]|uniref:Uncharacterized protein n=1 Tax=Syncephalastrum racemosum TaxID=13706 RepID=A0A1X2HUQ2_SYNRA|nr:hypothetical protein BCR43DRAFT_510369 [Syncephalastrum racemosum]